MLCTWDAERAEVFRALEAKKEAEKHRRLPTMYDLTMIQFSKTPLERGFDIVTELNRKISRFDQPPFTRYLMQKRLHARVFAACAPLIFGSAFRSNQLEILKRTGWESMDSEIAVSAPRRAGKSEGLAQAIAVVHTTIPRVKILIVAASSRAASGTDGILHLIKIYVREFHQATEKAPDDKEHLFSVFSKDDVREIRAFTQSEALRYVLPPPHDSSSRSPLLLPLKGILQERWKETSSPGRATDIERPR